MDTSPAPKAEHLAIAIVILIANGIFPDRAGVSLVVRQLLYRAIELADRPLLDIVQEVVAAWGVSNQQIKDRAGTILEVVSIEEESYRRLKGTELKPLPDTLGVLYDQEHVDGVGGFHVAPEDGGMWIDCVTDATNLFGAKGKTLISEHFLRRQGYEVPPFTGAPCPRCFPEEQGK